VSPEKALCEENKKSQDEKNIFSQKILQLEPEKNVCVEYLKIKLATNFELLI